jgi:hypothetical protein
LFSGNHMPTLRVINKAISRRFNRIPFSVTIAADQVNKNLTTELKQEAPGILAWMIEGCLEWQRIGLCPPQAVTDATDSYLESQDIIGEWIEENLERASDGFFSSRDGFIAQMVTPRERQWHHQHQPVISQLLWIVAISCTEPPSMGKAPTQPPSEASRNIFGTCHSNGRHLGPWVARFDLAKVPAKH